MVESTTQSSKDKAELLSALDESDDFDYESTYVTALSTQYVLKVNVRSTHINSSKKRKAFDFKGQTEQHSAGIMFEQNKVKRFKMNDYLLVEAKAAKDPNSCPAQLDT